MEILWAGLIYNGFDFSDKFSISSDGRIKNIKDNKYPKIKREGNLLCSILWYEDKAYRVNIGEAQMQSGLEKTVDLDNPTKVKSLREVILEEVDEMIEERLQIALNKIYQNYNITEK